MNCKIIKLSNGEELIADVHENSDKYTINNPMVFLTSTMTDPNGNTVDVTFMKDWLNNSDVKTIDLYKDRVVAMTDASKKCVQHYTLEKEKNENDLKMQNELDQKELEQFMKDVDNIVDQMINSTKYEEEMPYEDETPYEEYERSKKRRKKRRKRKSDDSANMIPKELQERPMIYLNMVIPPEAIMNLISSGILEPEMLQIMIDEVKKKAKFTGDEKNHKDFGNRFSDWNPDPKSDDYL